MEKTNNKGFCFFMTIRRLSLYLFPLMVCAISTKEVHSWTTTTTTTTTTNNHVISRRDGILQTVLLTTTMMMIRPAMATDDNGYSLTSRGIKYKVIQEPNDVNSDTPIRAQKVKAKYTLYLNGFPEDTDKSIQIDSSNRLVLGEKPFEFYAGVSQVIKGWDLAIMDMRLGEARKLVIPSELGYGEKGAGGKIPGGATLYFIVELADIGTIATLNDDQKQWLLDHPL